MRVMRPRQKGRGFRVWNGDLKGREIDTKAIREDAESIGRYSASGIVLIVTMIELLPRV
jgi:hypothetical protein